MYIAYIGSILLIYLTFNYIYMFSYLYQCRIRFLYTVRCLFFSICISIWYIINYLYISSSYAFLVIVWFLYLYISYIYPILLIYLTNNCLYILLFYWYQLVIIVFFLNFNFKKFRSIFSRKTWGWFTGFIITSLTTGRLPSQLICIWLFFLGAHFVWAFNLLFLFSGRGYWQENFELQETYFGKKYLGKYTSCMHTLQKKFHFKI